ncbi:MAG: hypothetical protein IJ634_00740 [Bacteroidales bacterium]|nr:hypothetical protein [Bacteroidales bacterium]
MKSKISFLFSVLAIASIASAQSYNSALLTPVSPYNSLVQNVVRSWNEKYVVTFHSNPDVMFSCTDYSNFSGTYNPLCFASNGYHSDALPSNYMVEDVRIMDDTAWFCGLVEHGTPQRPDLYGLVGWFDLNNFISGIFEPHFIELPFSAGLYRMAVYRDRGQCKAVCIGYDKTTMEKNQVVEIDNVATSTSCNCHTLPNTSGITEICDDILYTGTNVVVIGRAVSSTYTTYCVRVADNPSSISSTQFNKLVVFIPSTNELNGVPKATHLGNGDIAMIYDRFDGANFTSRLRVIKTSSFPPSNAYSQEFVIYKDSEASDMVYHKKSNKLVVLQPNQNFYSYLPQFTFLEPYNTSPYSADITHFYSNYHFNSMDLYKKDNIVAVSADATYLQYIPILDNSGCPFNDPIMVNPILNNSELFLTRSVPTSLYVYTPYFFSKRTYGMRWECDCCNGF